MYLVDEPDATPEDGENRVDLQVYHDSFAFPQESMIVQEHVADSHWVEDSVACKDGRLEEIYQRIEAVASVEIPYHADIMLHLPLHWLSLHVGK